MTMAYIHQRKPIINQKIKKTIFSKILHVEQFHDNSVVHMPKVDFRHGVEYQDQSHERLDENKLINENNTNFKGWSCNIGLEQLSIGYSGHIHRGGCQWPRGRAIGHLSRYQEIDFPIHPIICNLPGCYCPTDIRISKSLLQETS